MWQVRVHGKDKRHTWLKLHLAVDQSERTIEAFMLTADNVHDSRVYSRHFIHNHYSYQLMVIYNFYITCFIFIPPKAYSPYIARC